jgi:hypothetical protein
VERKKAAKIAKAQTTSDAEIAPTTTTTNAEDDQRKEGNADDAPLEKAARKTEEAEKEVRAEVIDPRIILDYDMPKCIRLAT